MGKVENNYTSFYLPSRERHGQEAEHTTKGSKMGSDKAKREERKF